MADLNIIERAIIFATEAHAGQTYGPLPYVSHPIMVMTALADYAVNDITQAAAILHDVVEDTDHSPQDIDEHFGPYVAALVDILTHDEEETYFQYIERIATTKNLFAIEIKRADLFVNMQMWGGVKAQRKRYEKALNILTVAADEITTEAKEKASK